MKSLFRVVSMAALLLISGYALENWRHVGASPGRDERYCA
jgi:hypothetical protein